ADVQEACRTGGEADTRWSAGGGSRARHGRGIKAESTPRRQAAGFATASERSYRIDIAPAGRAQYKGVISSGREEAPCRQGRFPVVVSISPTAPSRPWVGSSHSPRR